MKILVISDIHGNMKALETAMEIPHDEVICLGDLVDYGPSPREVIDFMMENNIPVIKGNHDNAVATGIDCGCSYEIKHLSIATRDYTKNQLDDRQMDFLKNLPVKIEKEHRGGKVLFTHGSPRSFYEYIKPQTPDAEIQEMLEGVEADLLVVGHSHIPMTRNVGNITIVNPGSAGQPRDGIPRASCAVLDTDSMEFEIYRLEYDMDSVVDKIRERMPHCDELIAILKNAGVNKKEN